MDPAPPRPNTASQRRGWRQLRLVLPAAIWSFGRQRPRGHPQPRPARPIVTPAPASPAAAISAPLAPVRPAATQASLCQRRRHLYPGPAFGDPVTHSGGPSPPRPLFPLGVYRGHLSQTLLDVRGTGFADHSGTGPCKAFFGLRIVCVSDPACAAHGRTNSGGQPPLTHLLLQKSQI